MAFQVESKSSLVEKEYVEQMKFCKRIINKYSGFVIYPSKDPLQRFALVFKQAKMNPEEFEIEMMSEITSPVDEEGNIKWIEEDLKAMSFPELKKVGTGLSVTARDKDTLIKRILDKQAKKESEEE